MTNRIPNIVHLMYGFAEDFGGKPFSLVHYLCIKSLCDLNKPDVVNFYYKYEPTGEWWEKAKPYLNLVEIEPPTEIFGNPLMHVAHQADIVRLQALIADGGIYIDLDVICTKPFTDLLDNKFVIGAEGTPHGTDGLCNAVLMSEPNSKFATTWLSNYTNFRSKGRDQYWNEHSVYLPLHLSKQIPNEIHIEPYSSFHYPLYHEPHLKMMFEETNDFSDSYCHHLWETVSWEPYLKDLTIDEIENNDTTFNLIARRFI